MWKGHKSIKCQKLANLAVEGDQVDHKDDGWYKDANDSVYEDLRRNKLKKLVTFRPF